MIFFTSDTHFDHANVVKFDNAPFNDIHERDEAILANHNAIVRPNDTVYHLGDVSWSQAKLDWYLKNAHGRIHLIRGNHDDRLAWRDNRFASRNEALYIKPNGVPIYLSHYAMRVWRNSCHGAFHLFGHSHGNMPGYGRSMDVGVAPNDYKPVSLDEVVAKLSVYQDFKSQH